MIDDTFAPAIEWLDRTSLLKGALFVVAVFLILRWTWRAVDSAWPGIKTATKFFVALGKLPEFMGETRSFMSSTGERLDNMEPTLSQIRHEVFPNNGGSMRDDLAIVDLRLEQLDENDKKQFEHGKKDNERLGAIEAELKQRLAARQAVREAALGLTTDELDLPYPNEKPEAQ